MKQWKHPCSLNAYILCGPFVFNLKFISVMFDVITALVLWYNTEVFIKSTKENEIVKAACS